MGNPNLVRKVSDNPTGGAGEVSYANIIAQDDKANNWIINGNFDVWSRGTSHTFTGNGYYADRWFAGHTGANTISRQAVSALGESTYCMRITYAAGTTNVNDFYYMEDRDVAPLRGKTVTWSMYVRRSGALNNGFAMRVFKNSTANTRTGGTWNEIAATTFLDTQIESTGGWSLLSVTFSVPNDGTAAGLRLNIVNMVNITVGGTYFEVTQMMLNIGTSRSSFRLYGVNLASEVQACQRYYFQTNYGLGHFKTSGTGYYRAAALATGAQTFAYPITFPVTMRITPTITVDTSGTSSGITDASAGASGPDASGFGFSFSTGGAGNFSTGLPFKADAEFT